MKESSNGQPERCLCDQVAVLYQNTTTELEGAKQTGWRVVFTFGAAVAFLISREAHLLSTIQQVLLCAISFVGAIFATCYLRKTRSRIQKYRNRLMNLYEHDFDKELLKRFDSKLKEKQIETCSEKILFAFQLAFIWLIFFVYALPLILFAARHLEKIT